MKIISFVVFKENCKHVRWKDVTLEKTLCLNGLNYERRNKIIEGRKHPYSPCSEKYCPVLNKCKEA